MLEKSQTLGLIQRFISISFSFITYLNPHNQQFHFGFHVFLILLEVAQIRYWGGHELRSVDGRDFLGGRDILRAGSIEQDSTRCAKGRSKISKMMVIKNNR